MQLFEQIKEDNRVKYGTKVGHYIQIIINQYSNRTHFIYELIQNAEDAGASYVRFSLFKDRLELRHDGRPFNEEDIIGVCGIADGTKDSDDGMQIGHFGIGFKSVYGYTASPEIYSGKYHFRIDDYLNPVKIRARMDVGAGETCLVVPFNKDTVPGEKAFQEISAALTAKLNSDSLLILDRIRDVRIEVEGHDDVIHIEKTKEPYQKSENVYSMTLFTTWENILTGARTEKDSSYLYFTDTGKEATAIIFGVKEKELIKLRNSKIYAYFPTARESHQNFYIHAPFDTTPARDNFKEGESFGQHNILLVSRICQLIRYAFRWFRDNGYLTLNAFGRVFPIYKYDSEDILYPIYQNSIDFINSGENILPTNNPGVYKNIDKICMPMYMNIVSVFDDEDLQRLTGNHDVYWFSKDISTTAYIELNTFLVKNFKFKIYEWKDLVLRLRAGFLREKSLSWMEHLMEAIESFCIKRLENQSHFMDVSDIPFVRLSNGDQITVRKNGKLQVYLNNPKVCPNKIEMSFLQSDIIRGFYERALQIPIYDVIQEVRESILPKYRGVEVTFHSSDSFRENVEDLKTIKDAILDNPKIVEELANCHIVTDGSKWYLPSELYIPSDDIRSGYAIMDRIVNFHYLFDRYFTDGSAYLRLDVNFFRAIGCCGGVRCYEVTEREYLDAVGRYQGMQARRDIAIKIFQKKFTQNKLNWSLQYEGFPQVFQNMTFKKSLDIALFLNRNANVFDVRGELVAANDKNFSGKEVDNVIAYSMLGLELCFEKWIYVQNDDEPHSVVDVERSSLREDYDKTKRLMEMLPFKEANTVIARWIEENFADHSVQIMVKNLLAKPEKLEEYVKARAKSEAQREAREKKRGNILEQIQKADKSQKEARDNRDVFEVSPISENALKKREEKLEQEFNESMDHKVLVSSGLRFTLHVSKEAERAFLMNEYGGFCQICHTSIKKYDDTQYFEAINVIKPSAMDERYTNSIGLGWNSLCLCPNCAAEYHYCSKKISTIYEQVMQKEVRPDSEDTITIEIELPEKRKRQIHYSPRHFLALKKALEIYAGDVE